jgi:hypothetical protein
MTKGGRLQDSNVSVINERFLHAGRNDIGRWRRDVETADGERA